MANAARAGARIRIGVSACLLGDEVRYDGGHKRDTFLTTVLGPLVEWVKVCPEVESGMGTPRESIRLIDESGRVRLLTVKTGVDHTDAMTAYAAHKVIALGDEDLCGYVLKKDSPSCGMTRVKVYGGKGPPAKTGVGVFAQALLAPFPHLPVEEEGRLRAPRRSATPTSCSTWSAISRRRWTPPRARSCWRRSRTIAWGSCRWSCRSRCCATTCGSTTCSTWRDRSTWRPIRKS